MINTIRTLDVAETDKLDYWKDILCRAYEGKNLKVDYANDFHGKIECLDRQGLSKITQGSSLCSHSDWHAKRDNPQLCLMMHLFGDSTVGVGSTNTTMNPGDFIVTDSEQPYDFRFDSTVGLMTLQFSKSTLLESTGIENIPHGLFISKAQPQAMILSNFMQSCWSEGWSLSDQKQDIPTAQIGSLLLHSVLNGQTNNALSIKTESAKSRAYRISQIKHFIHENLANNELGPTFIANYFSISTRSLHKLFSEEKTTLSSYIRAYRLEGVRQALIGSKPDVPIKRLVGEYGFSTVSHLGQLFKETYGCSPAKYRKGRSLN